MSARVDEHWLKSCGWEEIPCPSGMPRKAMRLGRMVYAPHFHGDFRGQWWFGSERIWNDLEFVARQRLEDFMQAISSYK